MKTRFSLLLAGSALAALALAGCTASTTPSTSGAAPSSPTSVAPAPASKDLTTTTSKLGTIVVDGKGMTAYMFDKDVAGSGKSNCAGPCAAAWPAITSTSTTPSVSGVTGAVATIPGTGGANQITIDGHPIYTFASDKAAGDTNGQGVGKIWWVIGADGKEISKVG
jgi:predicted lipoprotein with Yx(FWY)xxD motif